MWVGAEGKVDRIVWFKYSNSCPVLGKQQLKKSWGGEATGVRYAADRCTIEQKIGCWGVIDTFMAQIIKGALEFWTGTGLDCPRCVSERRMNEYILGLY